MPVAARSIGDALVTIAGRDLVRDDTGSLDAAIVDGLRPRWVVGPASIDELSRVIALAASLVCKVEKTRCPVSAACTAIAAVSLSRISPTIITPHRQWLAIDPPGIAARTLGGVTATNASGPLRARFGSLRDLLLGARFVQPDGVVTWGGSKVVKSVSGYDVPKLMVGALGTLGVLTELTLRLHPLPDSERSWLVPLDRPQAAQDFVARLIDSPLQPSRVEQ